MPAHSKPLDNMSKHLTEDERKAREEAEAATIPIRAAKMKAPPYVNKDKAAKRYWTATLKRMEGISLLDDLDTDMLAVYCSMLARRDAMNDLCLVLMAEAQADAMTGDERLEAMDKISGLSTRLQSHERTLLQYAEKLGLTPAGRVRLARKRAEAAELEPADDLFGD